MMGKRAWIRRVVLVVVMASLAFVAIPQSVDALCGDCAVLFDRPECVSPPPNFISCHFFYEWEYYVIAGKIVRVAALRCEGTVECAY